jgi:hypothetical protein
MVTASIKRIQEQTDRAIDQLIRLSEEIKLPLGMILINKYLNLTFGVLFLQFIDSFNFSLILLNISHWENTVY